MLNHTAPTDVKLHLFTSNITPAETDVLSTYSTNEVTDASYAAKTLTGTNFTVATVSGTTTATYPRQTFTFAAAATVYGFYITNNSDTALLWVARFDAAPFNIPSGGGTIGIDPAIELA